MSKKQKGFTLIELLAILVILAIIAAIAVPNIFEVINTSTKSSIESTTNLLAQAAQNHYSNQLSMNDGIKKVDLTEDTIVYTGDRPDKGFAFFDEEGRAYIKMYYNGYCVVRNYDGKIELDETSPSNCEIADMITITLYPDGGKLVNADDWSVEEGYASIIVDFAGKLSGSRSSA